MQSPVKGIYEWSILDEVESTQDVAVEILSKGWPVGAVLARDQTKGRGRFGRVWKSHPGDSLTFSLIFRDYSNHPKPYLVGMAVAIAAAGVLHGRLRWPNDLTVGGLKLGGILTEMITDVTGQRVPVVGIGINLNQREFPEEIADLATSAALAHGGTYDAETIAKKIVQRLETLPEPTNWDVLAPIWNLFDATPGKRFKLASGEEAIALGIGSEGQLLCSVNGESQAVMAADAIFGGPTR